MYTALVLPLLLLAAPADKAVRAERSVGGEDPAIQIWISNDRHFLPGEEATVQVKTREDGYLVVLHVDPDGHLRVLFPIDPGDDNYARGGKKYDVRGRGGHGSFTTDDTKGRGTIYAAVSHDPFRFDQFVLGDHWDYHQLSPQRFSTEPEQELNDLVRRMADGGFDYDILTYDVVERVVYANDYSSSGGWYGAYAGCGYSYYGCARGYYGYPYGFSIAFSFGTPYYPYYPYYHRYYYDPFYAGYAPYYGSYYYPYYPPYYYQPYYSRYRPVYAYPCCGYPYYPRYGYGYPGPHGGYYGNGNGWAQPYTPYRFRGAGGTIGYSNRRYSFVNTSYVSPSVRTREAVGSSPVRRASDIGPAAAGRPAVERRTTTPAGATAHRAPERRTERVDSRASQPYIEARRAREPEQRRSVVPDSRDVRGRTNLATEVRPESRSEDAPRRAVERSDEVRGPTEVRPLSRSEVPRRAVDRPEEVRGGGSGRSDGDGPSAPRGEARRAETGRSDPAPMRSDPQWADRGGDRGGDGGSDRGSYSPPSRSDGGSSRGSYSPPARSDGGGSRGGWSGGGGGGGGGYHGGGAPSGGGARGGGGGRRQ